MTIDEVKQFFGSYSKAARVLGITRQTVCEWKRTLGHVPAYQQAILEKITNGELSMSACDTQYQPNKKGQYMTKMEQKIKRMTHGLLLQQYDERLTPDICDKLAQTITETLWDAIKDDIKEEFDRV